MQRPRRSASSPSLSSRRDSSGAKLRAVRSIAQQVERAMLGGRQQPSRRIFWDAAYLPDLEGAAEGVLRQVLGQRQIVDAEQARERGDEPP